MRVAVPNKGRLKTPALRLLEAAGLEPVIDGESRALMSPTRWEGVSLVFLRPEDIPVFVAVGAADLGITGLDYVAESGVEVEVEARLDFGRARLVLAVPRDSGFDSPSDLPDGVRVASKYERVTRAYLERVGVCGVVVKVSGAVEVMPSLGVADAVVDVSSTGTTLALHGLKPIDVVMETSAVLIRSPRSNPGGLVGEVAEAVRSVVRARTTKLVLMNVPGDRLRRVLEVLPAMEAPMVARLESPEPAWEVLTAVPERDLARVIIEARRRGARGIVVLGVERVVP
ncbi:ATP phosphoribosyltransferase [Stetteria hydrogenophila]